MENNNENGSPDTNGADTAVNENLQSEFDDLTTVNDKEVSDEKGQEGDERQVKEEVKEEVKRQEKPVLKEKPAVIAKEEKVVEPVSKSDYDALAAKFAALEKSIAKPAEPEKPLLTKEELESNVIPVEQMLLNQFEQKDMHDMLSGDIDRAKPVLQKFAKGIIDVIYFDLEQKANQQKKFQDYANKIHETFYTDNKDLVGHERIVKYVYDDMCKLNPGIMPHELMKDVAIQTRQLITSLKGKNADIVVEKKQPIQRIVTTRGGEGADVRPQVSSTPQLTEQEKEMFELIEDHKKLQ